jgi:hypothetical protein
LIRMGNSSSRWRRSSKATATGSIFAKRTVKSFCTSHQLSIKTDSPRSTSTVSGFGASPSRSFRKRLVCTKKRCRSGLPIPASRPMAVFSWAMVTAVI